ncbi:SRPBCC family protein [Rhodococcus triatomae]
MADTMKTEESIMIARPIDDVFEYMSDPDNAASWSSNLVEYTLDGKPDEIGTVTSFVVKVAGLRLAASEELTGYEKDKSITYRSKDSKIGYERTLTFAVDGAHTRVTWIQEAETGTGLFKFADSIVQKLYARDVRGNLENAKTILEA